MSEKQRPRGDWRLSTCIVIHTVLGMVFTAWTSGVNKSLPLQCAVQVPFIDGD